MIRDHIITYRPPTRPHVGKEGGLWCCFTDQGASRWRTWRAAMLAALLTVEAEK